MKPWKWFILIIFWFIMFFTLKQCGNPPEKIEEKPISEETTLHVVSYEPIQYETPEPKETEYVILLAKIIQAECGVDWPDWACMAIGEVVLNRVDSPEFPNTIEEVLTQENQYEPVNSSSWETLQPEERYINLAKRLLDGERVLNDKAIVFQSLYPELGYPIVTYKDMILGTTTYFARSDNTSLYE